MSPRSGSTTPEPQIPNALQNPALYRLQQHQDQKSGLRSGSVQPAYHLIGQHRLVILKTVARTLNAHEHGRGTGGHRHLQTLADVLLDEFVRRALNDENWILHLRKVWVGIGQPIRTS